MVAPLLRPTPHLPRADARGGAAAPWGGGAPRHRWALFRSRGEVAAAPPQKSFGVCTFTAFRCGSFKYVQKASFKSPLVTASTEITCCPLSSSRSRPSLHHLPVLPPHLFREAWSLTDPTRPPSRLCGAVSPPPHPRPRTPSAGEACSPRTLCSSLLGWPRAVLASREATRCPSHFLLPPLRSVTCDLPSGSGSSWLTPQRLPGLFLLSVVALRLRSVLDRACVTWFPESTFRG